MEQVDDKAEKHKKEKERRNSRDHERRKHRESIFISHLINSR
jgi:hypothetical protein